MKSITLSELFGRYVVAANTSVFTDIGFEVAVALLGGGVDAAPDLELTVVVDFDLVEVLDVEVVHGFDLVKFVVDLFFDP